MLDLRLAGLLFNVAHWVLVDCHTSSTLAILSMPESVLLAAEFEKLCGEVGICKNPERRFALLRRMDILMDEMFGLLNGTSLIFGELV